MKRAITNKKIWNNFLYTLFGFQKTKSRLHLLIIIIIHIVIWLLFLQLPLLFYPVRVDDKTFWYREFISKLLPISLFYVNYYLFLPRFFEKRRYKAYFGWVFICLFFILITDTLIREKLFSTSQQLVVAPGITRGRAIARQGQTYYIFSGDSVIKGGDSVIRKFGRFPPPFPIMEKKLFGVPLRILFFSFTRTIFLALFLLLTGGMIRLAYSFIKSQNEKKSLENLNLNAEVNFLKSQINPHFLFNTLNSIYSQAHNKSDHTEYSILKLSELLRYVLYESGEEKVPLEKDIQYINNYIDLQRIRLSSKVKLCYQVNGRLDGNTMAPLMLITFIENAFKHGISYTQASVIHIDITVFEKTLTLNVSNPVVKSDIFTQGGLGLKNVTRRLELLYPGKHLLTISQTDNQYLVNLKLDLT
jgi:hypothetical protein